MARELRLTDNVLAIFAAMFERPGHGWYGLALADAADIGSATVYAALTRMERAGLVQSAWEDADPVEVGRPRRRLYSLTAEGARYGRDALRDDGPRHRGESNRRGRLPLPRAEGTA